MDLTEELAAGTGTSGDDFQSMKVVDLKKELKARGLPITGNKNELIERLQIAQSAEKGLSESSELEGFDYDTHSGDRITGLGSRDILTDDSLFDESQFSSPEKSVIKESNTPDLHSTNANSDSIIARPLKKRVIPVKDTNRSTTEKKLQLDRSDPVPVPFFSSVPSETKIVTPGRKLITVTSEKNGEATDKKVASLKAMTVSEKLAKRAERFNIKSNEVNNTVSKSASSLLPQVNTKKPITLSDTSNTADLGVLKKRAERFGQNVSTVMKQIEEKEKILKRKLKFGASAAAVSDVNEQERKKQRAERFTST